MEKGKSKGGGGSLSVFRFARSISNGVNATIPKALDSSIFVLGWHVATNNIRTGIFDANIHKKSQVIYPIIGGIVGQTIKNTIDKESYNTLPAPLRVVLSNPFLFGYVTAHFIFNYNDITNNPLPFIAETSLLATHLLAHCEH